MKPRIVIKIWLRFVRVTSEALFTHVTAPESDSKSFESLAALRAIVVKDCAL